MYDDRPCITCSSAFLNNWAGAWAVSTEIVVLAHSQVTSGPVPRRGIHDKFVLVEGLKFPCAKKRLYLTAALLSHAQYITTSVRWKCQMVTGRLVIPKEGRHACLWTDRPHILGAAEAPCAVSLIDRSFRDRAAATQRFRQERWGSGHRVQLSKGGAGGRSRLQNVILDLNSQQWQRNSTMSEHHELEQALSSVRAMGGFICLSPRSWITPNSFPNCVNFYAFFNCEALSRRVQHRPLHPHAYICLLRPWRFCCF